MFELRLDGRNEYYVVFSQGSHWIKRFLKPGFSHVHIITRDHYNWIVLNPGGLFLQVYIPPYELDVDYPRQSTKPENKIIKVTTFDRNVKQRFGLIGWLQCVTYSKYLLGLRISAITPFSLYKKLLRFSAAITSDPSIRRRHGIISIERIQ